MWQKLLKSPNKLRWMKGANEEFASLLGMQTWDLVPCPQKRRIIKSKWVFKIKRRPDRSIHKLKACLVAMGYSQVHGLDYQEVFSPTLRLETLRLICSLLAIKNWTGRQVDFKMAFLNGHLDETVYMEQPPGFKDPLHPNLVCQLKRSLYRLKQLPRQWNIKLHRALVDLVLTNTKYDPNLYFCVENNQLVGALSTHVDNLAIVGKPKFVNHIIPALGQHCKIGADEELNNFLSLPLLSLSFPSIASSFLSSSSVFSSSFLSFFIISDFVFFSSGVQQGGGVGLVSQVVSFSVLLSFLFCLLHIFPSHVTHLSLQL
jgi:hypothetical protein